MEEEETLFCSNCGEEWPFDGDCDECQEEEENFMNNQNGVDTDTDWP